MDISCNTEFNIGDTVYCISREPINNNFYCDTYIWKIYSDEYNISIPLRIFNINIKVNKKQTDIFYQVDNILCNEKDVFYSIEEAQNECDKRNPNYDIIIHK